MWLVFTLWFPSHKRPTHRRARVEARPPATHLIRPQGRGSRSSNDLIGGKQSGAAQKAAGRSGRRQTDRGVAARPTRVKADARDSLDTHTEVVDGFRTLPSLPYLALGSRKKRKVQQTGPKWALRLSAIQSSSRQSSLGQPANTKGARMRGKKSPPDTLTS